MPQQRGSKGNPASHRMGNDKLKARRARSWARAQIKKARNRELNERQRVDNASLRAAGQLTPHEAKRAKRRARRDALREQGLLPPIGTTRAVWNKERKAA